MKKEDIQTLKELAGNLIELEKGLEDSFNSNDVRKFESYKKAVLDAQEKILKTIK